MPPLPAQPGIFRVVYNFDVGEDLTAIVRRFYAYAGTPPTAGDISAMCASARGPIGDLFATLMSTDTFFTTLEVQDLSSDLGQEGSQTGETTGSRSGDNLGADTATLVNYSIGRHYRGGKPRSYWPFGTSTDLDTRGIWSSDYVGVINAAMVELDGFWLGETAGGATVGGPRNISYYQGFTPVVNPITLRTRDVPNIRGVAIAPDVITAATCSQKVASQRRRDLQRR